LCPTALLRNVVRCAGLQDRDVKTKDRESASPTGGISLWRRIGPPIASAAILFSSELYERGPLAQGATDSEQVVLSRSEWLAKVEESRRRIDQMRREGRSLALPPPPEEQEAKELSQRVMDDESLRSGDIDSTDRGLLIFRGRSLPGERSPGDFMPFRPPGAKP
jgi:hypothetical protein